MVVAKVVKGSEIGMMVMSDPIRMRTGPLSQPSEAMRSLQC
jgi:hypothetical protein